MVESGEAFLSSGAGVLHNSTKSQFKRIYLEAFDLCAVESGSPDVRGWVLPLAKIIFSVLVVRFLAKFVCILFG